MRIPTSTRAAAVAAAACMALAPAAPAFATGSSSPELRQPLPITAAEFERGECPTVPEDKDGWHFVLPAGGKEKPEFVKLTVTFEPGGTQTITEFGPPSDKHAYVASEPGAKLVAAEAEIKGGDLDKFNLSHTCPATDTTGGSTGETTGETTEGTTTGGGEETAGGSTEGTSEGTAGETTEGTTGETTEGAAGGEETTGGTEGSTGEATEGVAGGEEPGESTGEGGNLAETGTEAPVAALAAAAAALLGAGAYLVMRRRKVAQD